MIHNWAKKDYGAKKDTRGLEKSMNGADLPVFSMGLILYFTFIFKQKRAILSKNVCSVIYS